VQITIVLACSSLKDMICLTPLLAMFGNPMEGTILAGCLIAFLAVYLVEIVAFWRILKKAGFAPAWSLTAIVPGGAFILLLVLAFVRWQNTADVVA